MLATYGRNIYKKPTSLTAIKMNGEIDVNTIPHLSSAVIMSFSSLRGSFDMQKTPCSDLNL